MFFVLIYSSFKDKESYEVFFPGIFTLQQPWGDDNYTIHLPQTYKRLTQPKFEIPLDNNRRVMHITHFDAAKAIITSGYIPQQKKSKYQFTYVYDGNSYITEQEKCLLYGGYYSWWSIELYDEKCDLGPLGNNDHGVNYYTSFLFINHSMYGTVKLSLKLRDFIECYARSRSIDSKKVLYKVGGTLRYTKEVCYVIIVCFDTDDKLSELETIDKSQSLVIKQPYSFFCGGGLPQGVGVSWDHYVFALYYPEQKTLKLGREEIDACLVEHRGFDSNGSYDESLLQHNCFQKLRRNRECPDVKFRNTQIPFGDLRKLLSPSKDMMSLQMAGMTLQEASHVDQSNEQET